MPSSIPAPAAPLILDRRTLVGVTAAAAFGAKAWISHAAPAPTIAPSFPRRNPDADAFAALMAYEPDQDPDAAFFRSQTPRARVVAPFASTQVHPRLDPRPRVATLVKPYGVLDEGAADGFSRQRYGTPPPGGVYVSRMTGWHDIVVGWGGTGLIPNPAMTDVAHRNGALALGVVFQPDRRLYDASVSPRRDVAAKLVSLARWFGFDGYFMNFEGGTAQAHDQVLNLITLMRRLAEEEGRDDFHIQFYDGFTNLGGLLPRAGHGAAADSLMLDQGWSGYSAPGCCSGPPVSPEAIHDACVENGLDPFAAYFGLQLYPGPGYLGVAGPHVVAPDGDGPAYGSLQLYSADDGLRTLLRVARDAGQVSADSGDGRRALYALERRLYSGGSQDPGLDNRPTPQQAMAYGPRLGQRNVYTHYAGAPLKPSDQAALPLTYGVADFAVERSVIGATPFITHFNTGEGERFWLGGTRVSASPWFNMGAQDLLPTWQWRREPLHPGAAPSDRRRLLTVDYDFSLGYEGGASLRLSGLLDRRSATRLWLYKTALGLTALDAIQIVFQGARAEIRAELGLVFEDAPTQVDWLAFADRDGAALAGGWRRSRIALADFSGRTVAAILIGVTPDTAATSPVVTSLNIGELFIGDIRATTPAAPPTGLDMLAWRPTSSGDAAELRLGWREDVGADHHDILHRAADGRRTWLGRVQSNRFYTADAPLGGTLEVICVQRRAPLSPSAAASIALPTT